MTGGGSHVVVGGDLKPGSLEVELGLGLGFGGADHDLDGLEGVATLAVGLPGFVVGGGLLGAAGHLGVDGAVGDGVTFSATEGAGHPRKILHHFDDSVMFGLVVEGDGVEGRNCVGVRGDPVDGPFPHCGGNGRLEREDDLVDGGIEGFDGEVPVTILVVLDEGVGGVDGGLESD